MNIAGMDASTTRTGYAAPDASVHSITPDRRIDRALRLQQIRDRNWRCIRLAPPLPDLVVIEGYGFGVDHAASARLGELGGVLRLLLFEHGIPWVEVPPATLKLFAVGDGSTRTKKKHMIAAALRTGAPAGLNDDEADAWHLRRMGLVACGLAPITAAWEAQALAGCKAVWPVHA